MADSLFQANWLDVSIEQQKYFVIMIKTAQQPLYYHGFGIVVLDLETFTKVRTKIYLFFRIFWIEDTIKEISTFFSFTVYQSNFFFLYSFEYIGGEIKVKSLIAEQFHYLVRKREN